MSGAELAALARWLLALEAIGWVFFPLLVLAVPGLRDRGLTVAKPFALLLLVYPAWFVAALGPPVFTAAALAATLAVGALIAWGLPAARRVAVAFLRAEWRYALAVEVIFIVAFLGYAWLRGYTPHIAGTEKPMELGFLAAATRQATMPPADPWFSGHAINYYYLGFAVVAALAKLTGIPAATAFNLGLATLVAATLVGGVGLVANLNGSISRLRALGAGLIGGYLLALAGNLYAMRDLLDRPRTAFNDWWWGGLGWKSSRVILDQNWPAARFGLEPQPAEVITEFPAFSFLLGDLHAHLLALPFTLLALAFALDAWRASPLAGVRPLPSSYYRLGIAALAIGALYALNSWDLPTYGALYLAALLLPLWRDNRRARRGLLARDALVAVGFAGLCVALFAPFYAQFTPFVGGQPFELPAPWRAVPGLLALSRVLGPVLWDKTPLVPFLTIYLLPFATGAAFLTWRWAASGRGMRATLAALPALALGAIFLRMPVFAVAGLIILLAGAVLLRRDEGSEDRFAALLFGAAFALVLLAEIVFVYDMFNHRVNTVFKVYFQTWTLLAVASGYALTRLLDPAPWRDLLRRDALRVNWWRLPVGGALLLLVLASAAYPLVAGRARTREFPARMGLDGLAVIRVAHPEEWAGITWVHDRVPPGAVVAEAPGCSYGDFANLPHNRVSAFAGVSTPLGWAAHQQQWRGGSPELLAELAPRTADLNTLYRTTDPAEATRILDRYGIEYVYVGSFERDGYVVGGVGTPCQEGGGYPAAGLAKFAGMLERVFVSEGGRVEVFRRVSR